MLIYGLNPVLEALRAHPDRVHYIAVSRDHGGKLQRAIAEAKRCDVAVRIVNAEQIGRMAKGGVHNGIVADVSESSYADLDAILEKEETRFVMILDGITDPQNFGAILRVADVFGVDVVVIPQHESVGLTPAAVKASAGASQWVAVAQVVNLSRTIEDLQKREFWIYGAAMGGDPIDQVDFRGKVAIVLGSEGSGIRRNVLEHCDRTVSIPMQGHVDSLNVAAAAAVVAWEVRRQNRA